MRISHLTLKNWKNFALADIAVPSRLFLVGPNASGKSNFLDALRFLRDLVSTGGGFQEAVQRRGGVSAIRCLSARRYPDIELAVSVESDAGTRWHYVIAFNQDQQRRPLLKKELVQKEETILLSRPSATDEDDPAQLTQTHLEQINVNKPFRELATFFASIRYLHVVPQLVREPDRSVGRANDPYGGDFLEQIAKTPEKTQRSRLRRIEHALQIAVPQLQSIELWRDERGTPHLRGKYEHWRPQGAWQHEGQFSDGTLRLLGLLWAVLETGGPLLLEEPELSLHPEVVRLLPQMLARVQRRTARQMFISTHSPDLLRDEGIGLDEVVLLIPSHEGTQLRLANSLDDIPRLLEGGLPLADAVIPWTRPEGAEQLALFDEG